MRISPSYLPVLSYCFAIGLGQAPSGALPEYVVKGAILKKLALFVEWPQESHGGESGPTLTIGVIGSSPFGEDLDQSYRRSPVRNRQVRLLWVKQDSELEKCDILFIARSERDRLKEVLAKLQSKPVLTVADMEGAAEWGVMINLTLAKDRDYNEIVRFEVNLAAARKAGLKLNSQLLRLARIVAM